MLSRGGLKAVAWLWRLSLGCSLRHAAAHCGRPEIRNARGDIAARIVCSAALSALSLKALSQQLRSIKYQLARWQRKHAPLMKLRL